MDSREPKQPASDARCPLHPTATRRQLGWVGGVLGVNPASAHVVRNRAGDDVSTQLVRPVEPLPIRSLLIGVQCHFADPGRPTALPQVVPEAGPESGRQTTPTDGLTAAMDVSVPPTVR